MEIRQLCDRDIVQVAKLEKLSYPGWMCMGYKSYLSFFQKARTGISVGAFQGTMLKGYMIGMTFDDTNEVYVADLVSLSPKALLPMMKAFFTNCEGKFVKGECRKASHQLILHLNRRFDGLMTILEDRLLPRYFRGEDGHKLRFEILSADKLVI